MAALSWHVKRSWLVVQRGLLSKLPLCMIVRSLWITSCGYGGQGAHWRPQVQTLHGKIHVLQGSTRDVAWVYASWELACLHRCRLP